MHAASYVVEQLHVSNSFTPITALSWTNAEVVLVAHAGYLQKRTGMKFVRIK